jgi:Animal haem peroxidase
VPYSLTEEFVAVYRMHPLIPDNYTFRAVANDGVLQEREFAQVAQRPAMELMDQVAMQDLFYSFGTAHPGAITLHNYPRGLQNFQRPDGIPQDLAATDVLRSRELGVPRYNEFRRLLHLIPIDSFEDLTDNAAWVEELRRVYDDDVEQLDLLIGMYAENPPQGFAFSDTAFRIFVLMASRRLNSDRFLTTDYNEGVYTKVGIDWVNDTDMSTVLLRHYPTLTPALRGVENAFWPWTKVSRE